MSRLIHIDTLCQECGYFTSDYRCENTKNLQSKCITYSCPLGYTAEKEDMKKIEPSLYRTLTQGEWLITFE